MTGLDKILSQIQAEAQASVDEVLAEATKQASALMQEAETQAAQECRQIAQQSQAAVADALSRARSAAALQKRQAILAEKQRLINEVIEQAKQSLSDLPAEAYFGVIVKMAVKSALPQKGEIMFSARDLGRLPQDFEQTLNAALQEKGATLAVSRETRPIDGGFVLAYGGIEENCSFAAMFDAAHETLQDKVHELLFS